MKMPRFRIAWLMVAVAIAGIDFGVIRTLLAELFLVMGALSMANVLVVGLLIAQQRPSSRPFLWGFEVFGAMALALYILLATVCAGVGGPIDWYLYFVYRPIDLAGVTPRSLLVAFTMELFVALIVPSVRNSSSL